MDEQELVRKSIELASKDLDLSRKELELKIQSEQAHATTTLRSPLGIAVVGGVLALFAGIAGNLIQGFNQTRVERLNQAALVALERQKHESQLLLQALDTGGDTDRAKTNLQFMIEAGLIVDKRLKQFLAREGDRVPSISPPSARPIADIVTPHGGAKWEKMHLRFYIKNGEPEWQAAVREALRLWDDVCGLSFTETNDPTDADIKVSWETLDSASAISQAYPPAPLGGARAGEIHLNSDFKWTTSGSPRDGIDVQAIMLHEIGIALGFLNSRDDESVMAPTYNLAKRALSTGDIKGIQAVYGAPSRNK